MEDIKCIKENATESGDCGNGWEGWRFGNTLYIEHTGSLEYFFQDPYVPDDLMQIDCWDENMKTLYISQKYKDEADGSKLRQYLNPGHIHSIVVNNVRIGKIVWLE